MIRRPPRSTRTDTLFPYTTLFRARSEVEVGPVNGLCSIEIPLVGLGFGNLAPAAHLRQIPDRIRIKRSEEHTSELQSLMRISYAVFCLKKKNHIRLYSQMIHTPIINIDIDA